MDALAFTANSAIPSVIMNRAPTAVSRRPSRDSFAGGHDNSMGSWTRTAYLSVAALVTRGVSNRYRRSVAKHGPWWRPAEVRTSADLSRRLPDFPQTWALPNAQTVHLPYGASPRPGSSSSGSRAQVRLPSRPMSSGLGSSSRSPTTTLVQEHGSVSHGSSSQHRTSASPRSVPRSRSPSSPRGDTLGGSSSSMANAWTVFAHGQAEPPAGLPISMSRASAASRPATVPQQQPMLQSSYSEQSASKIKENMQKGYIARLGEVLQRFGPQKRVTTRNSYQ